MRVISIFLLAFSKILFSITLLFSTAIWPMFDISISDKKIIHQEDNRNFGALSVRSEDHSIKLVLEDLEKVGEIVTAFFTIVLAISTIMLWRATDRLWKTAADEAKITERAVKAAENSALAAETTVRMSLAHHEKIERPLLLAHITMGANHSELYDVKYAGLKYYFKNFGRTPAILTRIYSKLIITDSTPDALAVDINNYQKVPYGNIIGR